MFWHVLRFEFNYWLKQPMIYIFFLINAVLIFGAVSTDDITIGESIGNVNKNAPFTVVNFYVFMSLITMVMVTAFVQSTALRDAKRGTQGLIYAYPIKKFAYLMGRFTGATLVAIIPILGVSAGILLAQVMPWQEAERIGPTYWGAHLNGLLMFGVPNTIFISAIIFAIAILTRSTIASFVGLIALLVGYSIAGNLLSEIDDEFIGMLLDPFGIGTYATLTKYWTVTDKNTMVFNWQPVLVLNRLIWMGVGLVIFAFAYHRFSFSEKAKRKKKIGVKPAVQPNAPLFKGNLLMPSTKLSHSTAAQWRQLINQARVDFLGIVKSIPFLVILLFGVLNLVNGLSQANAWYGLSNLPVTYIAVNVIRGNMYLFTIALIVIYSGVVVWKERDANVHQIYDALPHSNWVSTVSKLLAVLGMIVVLQVLSIVTAVIMQAILGYTNFEIPVYLAELLVIDFLAFTFLTIISIALHTTINNKYITYFAFTVVVILNFFIWRPLNIESYMVRLGQVPSYVYSDMNGFGPYLESIAWFNVYWILLGLVLLMLTIFLWMRGLDTAWPKRIRNFSLRFSGNPKYLMIGFMALWIICAGFVYYNTKVLNPYRTKKQEDALRAAYEKKYKYFIHQNQPRITDISYHIDVYPEQRNLHVKGRYILTNKSGQAIDSLLVNTTDEVDMRVEIEGARELFVDENLKFFIYQIQPPLQPGDSIRMEFQTDYVTKGFENQVRMTEVVQNGSFFNNRHFSPTIGYNEQMELSDKKDRKKNGLPEKDQMPALKRDCGKYCMNHYINRTSDWVNMETVISTSGDQIAVAPGSLVGDWGKDGRRYFRYKVDHPSLSFGSFISADYTVARDVWNGVKTEVYYHAPHAYNVDKMMNSIQKSLAYFTEHFGPYMHKQARIIEFPRYGSFAQAFPGTMPYSESIGFIASIEDEDDLDMVFYVVAHEMAHQWWAHQVIGANVEGVTMLSETLAQYAALMVMEKEYGRAHMQKFLKYEMDRYLRNRGREFKAEKPLMRVDPNQGYIHYRKGSVVMYYLKEMIGEDKVNEALCTMIDSFGYQEPPYPTAHHLVDLFRKQTPDSLQYLIEDLFETITLFENRVLDPEYEVMDDGRYKVTLTVECQKFRSDSLGNQTEVPIDDWIDIGIFTEPEEGKERGQPILLERKRINQPAHSFEYIVDAIPYEAGVDPNYYLVDRVPDDNVKKVKLK